MIKLTGLILNNFLSFKYAEISFDDLGLCLIQGHNKDEDDSNGAGKTTIASAICWCLFGKTVKGIAADDVVNWDVNKNCMVELTLDVDGEEVRIRRYRKFNEIGDAVEITIGGNFHEGKPTEMQPMVNQLIGFDFETFVNTTIYSQETSQMLGTATDSQRRSVFSKLLNLSRFERAHIEAKEKAQDLQKVLDDTRSCLEKAEIQVGMLEGELKTNETHAENYGADKELQIIQLKKDLDDIPERHKLKGVSRERENIITKLDEMDFEALEAKTTSILVDVRTEQNEKAKLEKQLVELPDVCPMCKRRFNKNQKQEAEEDIQSHIAESDQRLAEAEEKLAEHKKILDKLLPVRTELFELDQKILGLKQENEKIDLKKQSIQDQIDRLEQSENPFLKAMEEIQEKTKRAEQDVINNKASIGITNDILSEWKVVEWLYSKKGAPSFIIENSFDYIQNKANYYLMILTGGTFAIKLESEREIKSGKIKEEINLRIFHNEKEMRYHNASDGQRQRINIALLFAINSYCRSQGNLDFLLLDEVLDLSLDETGQERVLALLREISREVGTIFVISHKKGIANNFDSVLDIVYENGESRVI